MRVLYISNTATGYGSNKSLLEMIGELRDSYGVKPLVLLPDSGRIEFELLKNGISYQKEHWFNWSRKKEVPFYDVNFVSDQLLNCYLFRKIKYKLSRELETIDLIHTNTSVTQLGGFLSKKTGIPHLWHLREFGLEDNEDHGIIHDGGLKKAGRYFEAYSDLLIANSRAVKKKYSKYIKPEMIKVVHNGVSETENYIDRHFENLGNKEKVVFLLAGRICDSKGQLEALHAARVLKNEYGHKDFLLKFAGSGRESYLDKLDDFIENNKLKKNVEFLGYRSDMSQVRKNSDVALTCSRIEGFGRVTAEAMFAEMPVIGTDSGGTAEIIQPGETGFLYSPGDFNQLACHMEKFLKDRRLIEKQGRAGCERARKNFTIEINASRVFKCYKKVLGGKADER